MFDPNHDDPIRRLINLGVQEEVSRIAHKEIEEAKLRVAARLPEVITKVTLEVANKISFERYEDSLLIKITGTIQKES